MPNKSRAYCVACRKLIRGKPSIMRLQITNEEERLIARSKKLGFTSKTWKAGDNMQGRFHKQCFNLAMLVWQIAFHTRALSPRR